MFDPLAEILKEQKFLPEKIDYLSCGNEYTAVVLKNGNMGVCANLSYKPCCDLKNIAKLELTNIAHRITLIAYINAVNNTNQKVGKGDIFQILDFSPNAKNVMIGYFIPVVEKFDKKNIPLTVFDIAFEHPRVTNYSLLNEKLNEANVIIISSTTLMNNSLLELLAQINSQAKIYLLGPSSIMHSAYKKIGINAIFGTNFGKHNTEVEQLIKNGAGSREFLKFSQKVVYYL